MLTGASTHTIDRPNLSDIASEHIKRRIFDGELVPGEKIVEDEIASELGTSRTPVKLALAELHKEGLVDLVPRRGAFVRCFSHTDILELYEIRKVFEGLAGRLAARSMSAEELAELEQANAEYIDSVELLKASGGRDEAIVKRNKQLDMEFHRRILAASGNRNLSMLTGLAVVEFLSFLYGNPVDPVATGNRTREEHNRIIEAIREHDEAAADLLSQQHIQRAIDILAAKDGT